MRETTEATQEELDRLLNDPDVPMQPYRIWALADELAERMARFER